MTTNEKWKTGILIVGMLIIASIEKSLGTGRSVAQPQPIPVYSPPAPVAPVFVEPQYPIQKTVAINQNGWSDEINFDEALHIQWKLLEQDVWLDTKVNRVHELRDFPRNDTRWKRKIIHEVIKTIQFRVTPGTQVQTGTVKLTIQKKIRSDLNTKENLLLPVSSRLTESGLEAGPQWPSELTPTRVTPVWAKNLIPGKIVNDKVYPIEDVLYQIDSGWTLTPFSDNSDEGFESALTDQGLRIRLLNPDKPVVMGFKITKDSSESAPPPVQPLIPRQGVQNWNSVPTPLPTQQPVVQPYYSPERSSPNRSQPSYYRTSSGGPNYYPSHHNQ